MLGKEDLLQADRVQGLRGRVHRPRHVRCDGSGCAKDLGLGEGPGSLPERRPAHPQNSTPRPACRPMVRRGTQTGSHLVGADRPALARGEGHVPTSKTSEPHRRTGCAGDWSRPCGGSAKPCRRRTSPSAEPASSRRLSEPRMCGRRRATSSAPPATRAVPVTLDVAVSLRIRACTMGGSARWARGRRRGRDQEERVPPRDPLSTTTPTCSPRVSLLTARRKTREDARCLGNNWSRARLDSVKAAASETAAASFKVCTEWTEEDKDKAWRCSGGGSSHRQELDMAGGTVWERAEPPAR